MSSPERTLKALQLLQQGQQLHAAQKLAQAADTLQRAHALLPSHPGILVALGQVAEDARDYAAAEKIWRKVGALKPDSNFEGRLATCLFRLGRYAEAVPALRAHLQRHGDDPDALLLLGLSLSKTRDWTGALAAGERLEAVRPDERSLDIVLNSLFNLGRQDALDALLPLADRRHPHSPLVQSICAVHLLKRGDTGEGFARQPHIRWRYETGNPDPFLVRPDAWDGTPFDGLLLVEGEQGLGEEILAASMFNELARTGQRCVIDCEPRLIPLFSRSFPTLHFVSRRDDSLERIARETAVHRRVKAMDLARFFRKEPRLSPQPPWLVADAGKRDALRDRYRAAHPGRTLAGLSWKTRREFPGSQGKSLDPAALVPLLRVPGLAWFNVQYGDVRADLDALVALGVTPPAIDPVIDPTEDIDGLAAQLCALDVLVTTSNTTAHLAGALGVKTHLLLPRTSPVMWYWGYAGDGTPWYPSIRIHRSPQDDNWIGPVAAVAAQLAGTRPRNHSEP